MWRHHDVSDLSQYCNSPPPLYPNVFVVVESGPSLSLKIKSPPAGIFRTKTQYQYICHTVIANNILHCSWWFLLEKEKSIGMDREKKKKKITIMGALYGSAKDPQDDLVSPLAFTDITDMLLCGKVFYFISFIRFFFFL